MLTENKWEASRSTESCFSELVSKLWTRKGDWETSWRRRRNSKNWRAANPSNAAVVIDGEEEKAMKDEEKGKERKKGKLIYFLCTSSRRMPSLPPSASSTTDTLPPNQFLASVLTNLDFPRTTSVFPKLLPPPLAR